MSKTLVRIVGFLVFTLVAFAQNTKKAAEETRQKGPCDDAATQLDLNECFAEDFHNSDTHLDTIYANLLKQMQGSAAEKLKAAESAWIQYRELHCEAARFEYEGGSISPMVFAQCMATTTQHRIEDLRAAYGERNRIEQ